MKSKIIFLYILFLFPLILFAQQKQLLGDTIFWKNHISKFSNEVGMRDFTTSRQDFNFRFRSNGQIVEIWKDKDTIGGVLTNYIFRSGKNHKRKKTLFRKDSLPEDIAVKAYNIICKSGILNLPSSRDIKGWVQGVDGITYFIEHANKKNYWYKRYWTPSISMRDSLKEAFIVNDFVTELSTSLNLKERYESYRKSLPKSGCYNSGGMVTTCYISNSYGIGYSSSYRMPYGYTADIQATYIANIPANLGLSITHRFGRSKSYDLSVLAQKRGLFFINDGKRSDFLNYNYRQRRLHYIDNGKNIMRNHTISYGMAFKPLTISIGTDILDDLETKAGLYTSLSKWIPVAKTNLTGECSVFDSHIDYKIIISKSFYFDNSKYIIRGINVGLFTETFLRHTDAGLTVSIIM